MYERITTFTPLGIRFWDSVLDRQVSDHLRVRVFPFNGARHVVNAFRTVSGIFAFQGLPGMREIENSDFDEIPADPPSGKKPFLIEVTDELRRFLPVVFKVELPLLYLGIYRYGSTAAERFYLFSAPIRTVSSGIAVIRANLVDSTTRNPAAYAVIEVQLEGEGSTVSKWYGIADEKGSIAILFPYPAIRVSLSDSPPSGPAVLLTNHQWPLTIQVRWAPQTLEYPAQNGIPLWESISTQPSGKIRTHQSGISVTSWPGMLTYGQELLLKTDGADKAELWIDPAI